MAPELGVRLSPSPNNTIVAAYDQRGSVERMAAKTDLSERHIRLALAYRERFPDEVDEAFARGRRAGEELRAEFPTLAVMSIPIR